MINILICDDEKSYLEQIGFKIQKYISEQLNMECGITCCTSTDEMYEIIKSSRTDILFLDIMMNNSNSLDWLIEHQPEFRNIPVILMTAYPFETEKISEVDYCYYLLKPKATDEQLQRATRRAISSITRKKVQLETISFGHKTSTINLQDIIYIETLNNNIIIHMADTSSFTVYTTLKKFSEKLPPNFMRCHKCYMINMNHIHGYEPHTFILSNGVIIPVPPKKYKSMVNLYKHYLLNL